MRRLAYLVGTMAMLSAVTVVTAPSASADPCGASSYKSSTYQYVSYRNCSSSAIWLEAEIGGDYGWCTKVAGQNSASLHSVSNSSKSLWSWSVKRCTP